MFFRKVSLFLIPILFFSFSVFAQKIVNPVKNEVKNLEKTKGVPKVSLSEKEYDFGFVKPFSTLKHKFTIKNVGNGTLVIERVKGT